MGVYDLSGWYGNETEGKDDKYCCIVHLSMIRDSCLPYKENIHSSNDIAHLIEPVFRNADREKMVVVSLTSAMEPIAVEVIAVGGVSFCAVDVKNIFKHALLANAGNIICAHNHPSGNVTPSKDDQLITEKIKTAGQYLDIELVDHIIYGLENQYYSFRDNNWNEIKQ